MKRKIFINLLFFIMIFLLGFSTGRIYNWDAFKVNTEINFNLFDIVSLFITVSVAIYIAMILRADLQKKQSSRDIWINRFVQLEAILSRLDKTLSEPTIYNDTIVSTLHHLRSQLSHLKKTLTDSKNSLSNDEELNKLMAYINQLRPLLTDSPVQTNQQENQTIPIKQGKITQLRKTNFKIKIDDGIVSYSRKHLLEIRRHMNLIDNSIFLLKLKFASSNTITIKSN